jgi:hypothetical protein
VNKINEKLKALVLSLGLGAAMLSSTSVQAQGVFGDMLDNYYAEKETQSSYGGGALLRGAATRDEIPVSGGFTNGNFGDPDPNPLPLGSGLAILMGAGLGYVALKKKEDEQ